MTLVGVFMSQKCENTPYHFDLLLFIFSRELVYQGIIENNTNYAHLNVQIYEYEILIYWIQLG